MARYTLIGGTKNWSSWTLRPWLLMKVAQIPFDEVEITLREGQTTRDAIAAHSPSGFIPALKCDDGLLIWDSLAIAEFLAERHPQPALWPADAKTRAIARAVACEMHSGFAPLRKELPMDCAARHPCPALSDATQRNIARILTVWREMRETYGTGGPYLFGAFSIADAMYAPVVSRFVTYGIAMGETETAYADAVTRTPAMQEWLGACAAWAARP